jgi:hypothetical protein
VAQRLDFKGDPAFIDAVKGAADRKGWPLSLIIRTALEEWLLRNGFPLRAEPEPEPSLPEARPARAVDREHEPCRLTKAKVQKHHRIRPRQE